MVKAADVAPVGGGAVGAALRRNFGSFRSGLKICVFSEGGDEGFSRAASTLAASDNALEGSTFRSIGRADCAGGLASVPAEGLAVTTVFVVVETGFVLAVTTVFVAVETGLALAVPLATTAARLAVDSLRFEVGTDLAVMSMRGGAVISILGPSVLGRGLPNAPGEIPGGDLPNAFGDAAGGDLPNAPGDAAGGDLPKAFGDATGDDLLDTPGPTTGDDLVDVLRTARGEGFSNALGAANGEDFSDALGDANGEDFAAGRGGGGMNGRLALPRVDRVPAPMTPTPER